MTKAQASLCNDQIVAVIYGTETSMRVWYLLCCRVAKGVGEPVQPCEDSREPSLLA